MNLFPSLPAAPPIGSLFGERYRIQAKLGEGAMGIVLAARDAKMDVDCALKILCRAENRADAARVIREGRALMLITSPHVVRVFEVGESPEYGPYLVLERLDGMTLAQLAPLGRAWPWRIVVDYAAQVCVALSEAHGARIVHRDVKLSNIFLARQRDGTEIVKVLDFGIAKVAPPEAGPQSTLTKETLLGSPQYMSPEQVSNPREVDARTDLWSLGVVMFRLLTGEFPFTGESTVEISTNVTRARVPPLSARGIIVPPRLQGVLGRCLAKRAEERFGSAAELRAELLAIAAMRDPTPGPDDHTLAETPVARGRPRATAPTIAVAVVGVLAVAALGTALVRLLH